MTSNFTPMSFKVFGVKRLICLTKFHPGNSNRLLWASFISLVLYIAKPFPSTTTQLRLTTFRSEIWLPRIPRDFRKTIAVCNNASLRESIFFFLCYYLTVKNSRERRGYSPSFLKIPKMVLKHFFFVFLLFSAMDRSAKDELTALNSIKESSAQILALRQSAPSRTSRPRRIISNNSFRSKREIPFGVVFEWVFL